MTGLKGNSELCSPRPSMKFTAVSQVHDLITCASNVQVVVSLESDDVIHSTKFCSNMMKRDISANLYQTFFIFCSKILLNVLHNMSLTVPLPCNNTGFQTSPILKAFLATFDVPF